MTALIIEMKLIIISTENFFDGEIEILCHLFDAGLSVFHLRKPQCSEDELRCFLEKVPKEFHHRVVLHEHFSLLDEFDLKGIHLNRRNPILYEKRGITISKSCHTIEELHCIDDFDYVFLSPIFDSISKKGYRKAFSHEELLRAKEENIINEKVIALGGIMPENIAEIKSYGFGGVAILGGIWGNINLPQISQITQNFWECQKIFV